MVAPYVPDRGDIVWLTLDPQQGHEQAGRRPALVLSPRIYNARTHLAIVCPITNQSKGYPFEAPLPKGCRAKGVVLSDHVKSLDWNLRRAVKITDVDEAILKNVTDLIAPLLGLQP